VVSSSSTKRAARLAQKGKGRKVRFQGGTMFPLIVAAVVVLGVALVVFARTSRPTADAAPPTINDHWHVAYGFDLCDRENAEMLVGNKEETDASGQLISTEYLRTGVHSHDDGVIHWHALTSAATGHNATLGVFLDVYAVELNDSELRFPDDQLGGEDYLEGETKCGGEDGKLAVAVWKNFTDTGEPTVYTADFDNIRVTDDAMVIVVAFIPDGDDAGDIAMPPWAADLPALGALDQAPAAPTDGSTALLPTTTATGTATDGTATGDTASTGSSEPASTEAPTATTGG
jgi:hypothetical protein